MKKTVPAPVQSKIKSRNLWIVLGGVLMVFVGLYLIRGWIRMSVMPAAVEAAYGSSIHKVYKDEMSKLQDPVALLGYKNVKAGVGGCSTTVANGFSTQVDCSYDTNVFGETDVSPEGKQTLMINAEKLQGLLKANGWQGEYANEGSQYTSLVKLATSMTSGVVYQPDATYRKQVGNVECILSTRTAYSKPSPAATSTWIACSRSFAVLGQPSW